jgi:hypothetical protein
MPRYSWHLAAQIVGIRLTRRREPRVWRACQFVCAVTLGGVQRSRVCDVRTAPEGRDFKIRARESMLEDSRAGNLYPTA